jgi:hypothetical protein
MVEAPRHSHPRLSAALGLPFIDKPLLAPDVDPPALFETLRVSRGARIGDVLPRLQPLIFGGFAHVEVACARVRIYRCRRHHCEAGNA